MSLHGRLELATPIPSRAIRTRARPRSRSATSPSARAARSCCGPARERDVYDRMLDGRTATIERIYCDYEDAVHIARDGGRRAPSRSCSARPAATCSSRPTRWRCA